MSKLFRRVALGVLGGVLAIAPSVYAQTTDESGRTHGPAFLQLQGPEPSQQKPLQGDTVNLPTSLTVDVVFTPVTPCRIIDTRIAGGPIAGGTTRNFQVSGTLGFPAQGGTSGGCGIPFPSAAAVINYVAVNPAGPGDLRVTPFGTPMPLASIINYASVAGLNIANGVATPLSPGAFDITIQADVSATDLVADVMGFYRAVSCQTGTVKVLGQCYETALRAAADVFDASDTCRGVGGRLATGSELRSLRGASPLTLDGTGEWTDSVYVDSGTFFAMIIANSGGFTQVGTLTVHPFRCVFRPLP